MFKSRCLLWCVQTTITLIITKYDLLIFKWQLRPLIYLHWERVSLTHNYGFSRCVAIANRWFVGIKIRFTLRQKCVPSKGGTWDLGTVKCLLSQTRFWIAIECSKTWFHHIHPLTDCFLSNIYHTLSYVLEYKVRWCNFQEIVNYYFCILYLHTVCDHCLYI